MHVIRFDEVSLEHICPAHRFFEMNFLPELSPLEDSLKKSGVIQPLRLQQTDHAYHIVSGFRRFDCALKLNFRSIPALIMDENSQQLSLFASAVEENRFNRSLNIVEEAIILEKFSHVFGVPVDVVSESYMSLLGRKPSKKLLRFYEAILRLDEKIQIFLVRDRYPLHVVEDFLRFSNEDLRAIIPFLEVFHFSVSGTKEFLIWCHEIVLRDRISLESLLSETEVRKVFHAAHLTQKQKSDHLRAYLKRRRFPKLSDLESSFAALKKALDLPLEAPHFFEDSEIQMKLSFRRKEDLAHWGEKIRVAAGRDEMEKIIGLL